MSLLKVTGTNLVRDTNNMALLNTDDKEKNEYYSKIKLLQTQKEEINKVKSEIDDLKSSVDEIKVLLKKILENQSNG